MNCCGSQAASASAPTPVTKTSQAEKQTPGTTSATAPPAHSVEPVSAPAPTSTESKPKMADDMKLEPHPTIPKHDGPVLVVILDGFGDNEYKDEYNAVHVANTPVVDKLRAVSGRARSVKAHGTAVGLPSDADMGNSEVGHNALGAGQVVDQGARLVDIALETGKMYEGAGWKHISPSFANNTLHFIGLLSDGGVHSRADQLFGTVKVGQNLIL